MVSCWLLRLQTFSVCLHLIMQTTNILRLSLPEYADPKHSQFVSPRLCRFQTCSDSLAWLWWLQTFSDCLHLVMKTPNILRLYHFGMQTANILSLSIPYNMQFVSTGLCRLQTFSACLTRLQGWVWVCKGWQSSSPPLPLLQISPISI